MVLKIIPYFTSTPYNFSICWSTALDLINNLDENNKDKCSNRNNWFVILLKNCICIKTASGPQRKKGFGG